MCGKRTLILGRFLVPSLSLDQDNHGLTNEFSIRYDIRIELDPQSLGVICSVGTNVFVARILGVSSGISDCSLEDALVLRRRVVLQEYMFHPPETSPCKRSNFTGDSSWTVDARAGISTETERRDTGDLTLSRRGVMFTIERC